MGESLAAARRYFEAEFSLIPLKPKSKEPTISKWKQYQARRPTDREIVDWFAETDNNIGLLMGTISGGAYALDFDDVRLVAYTLDLDRLAKSTFVQDTSKGIHVILRAPGDASVKTTNYRDLGLPLDLRGEGSYIVAAPSIHPSGKRYVARSFGISILESDPAIWERRVRELCEEWPIVLQVLPKYAEGRRHDIDLGLAALLQSRGFTEGRALRVIRGIARVTDDHEIADRERAVRDTYARPPGTSSSLRMGDDLASNVSAALDSPTADAITLVALDELIAELANVVRFPRREDYILALLWASQSWLGSTVLPEKCLAYLAFIGPKSAGKTTATESLCHLAGGTMIAGGTEAAIRDILNGGESGIPPRALGIDEIDVKGKQLPDLEGIFRTGNRWTASYPMRVPQGKGWATVMTNVGGPKVFNYRTTPEDALASRTILIDLEKHDDARMIIEGLFNNPILDRIRFVLSKKAALASSRWDTNRMEDHMKSKDFIARVERLESQLPRGKQLGAVLLAISDAMGFDAESVIAQYVAEQREDSLEPEREILRDIYNENVRDGPDLQMSNKDVHGVLNQRLKDRGLPPVSTREWPRIRKELGIEVVRLGKGRTLTFGAKARKAIAIEGAK